MSGIDIRFRASGQQEIASAMDTMRQKASQTTSEMITNARKQADSARDQLKLIDDQVKALERRSRLEADAARISATESRDRVRQQNSTEYADTVKGIEDKFGTKTTARKQRELAKARQSYEGAQGGADSDYKDQLKLIRAQEIQGQVQIKLLRDNIETIKATSNVETNQMRKGSDALLEELDDNASPMRQMARDVAAERYLDEQSRGRAPKDEKNGMKDMFSSILGVDNINRFMGAAQQLASTRSGYDIIGDTSKTAGQAVGAIIGGIIGTLIEPGGGTMMGAGIGGSIGSSVGGGVGQLEQRVWNEIMTFNANKNRYEATTQKSVDKLPDLSSMGVSASDMLTTMKSVALTSASSANAMRDATSTLSIEKGAGVGQDVLSEYLTLFRGTQKDISSLVAGVMSKGKNSVFGGGDYSFLNEFMKKMAQMQNQMRSHQDEVSSGTVFSILEAFNGLGGAFRSKDSRSSGLIQTIDQSLSNPGSDAMKAASFLALRKMHPEMGMASIIEEQQKGLASPNYMKAMMGYINTLGGDRDTKIMNIAGAFGLQNNYSAARRLLDGKLNLPGSQQGGLEELGIKQDFKGMAEGKTTDAEKREADIRNKLLTGDESAIKAMADATTSAIKAVLGGSTIYMNNGYLIVGGSNAPIPKQNTTIPPKAHRSMGGADVRTAKGKQEALMNGDFGSKM